jgi:transposase
LPWRRSTMSEKGKRKKRAAADKLRIVLAGMQANVDVSDLCRREGINPTQYYGWKKQLLSSATKVFNARESQRNTSEEKKEAELRRMKDVVAEITAENLELKKGLSG